MFGYIAVAAVSLIIGFLLTALASAPLAEENERLKESLIRRFALCSAQRREIEQLREALAHASLMPGRTGRS